MSSVAILSKIEAIAERVAQPEGIEIVEIELKGGGRNRFLRISIDKPEGVTHGDCELISHQVGTILDVEDVVPGAYTLEVSSPGVERKLVKYKDFERFTGKKIKVSLREPVENSRRREDDSVSLRPGGKGESEVRMGNANELTFSQGTVCYGVYLPVHRVIEQGKRHRDADRSGRREGRASGCGAKALSHQRELYRRTEREDRLDRSVRGEEGCGDSGESGHRADPGGGAPAGS